MFIKVEDVFKQCLEFVLKITVSMRCSTNFFFFYGVVSAAPPQK